MNGGKSELFMQVCVCMRKSLKGWVGSGPQPATGCTHRSACLPCPVAVYMPINPLSLQLLLQPFTHLLSPCPQVRGSKFVKYQECKIQECPDEVCGCGGGACGVEACGSVDEWIV